MSERHSSKSMHADVGTTIKKFLDVAPNGSVVTADIKKGNKQVDLTMTMKIAFSEQQNEEKSKPKTKKHRFKPEDQPFMKRAMSSYSSESSSSTSFKGKKVEGPIPERESELPTFKPKDEQYYEVGPLTAKDNSLKERKAIWDAIVNGPHSEEVTKQVSKLKKPSSIRAVLPGDSRRKK